MEKFVPHWEVHDYCFDLRVARSIKTSTSRDFFFAVFILSRDLDEILFNILAHIYKFQFIQMVAAELPQVGSLCLAQGHQSG